MQDYHLTLCIPSLFVNQEMLRTPAVLGGLNSVGLDRLMSRADQRTTGVVGFVPLLFHLFGLAAEAEQDLPVAALTRLHSGHLGDKNFYLCADPVQLKADRDRVVMLGNHHLAIRMEEAKQLSQEFNNFFAEDGVHLEVLAADRWCLRVEKTPKINTTAWLDVMGQSIDPHLPRGEDALQWHRFLNEVQMLFHNSPVNQARQARRQAMINSLWFWGGGVLPRASTATAWQSVYSNETITPALAQHAGIKHGALAENAEVCLQQISAGQHLVVLDDGLKVLQIGDFGAWREFIERLNNDWIEPLLQALKTGRLAELKIQTADGAVFILTGRELRRWWKRGHSFTHFGSI